MRARTLQTRAMQAERRAAPKPARMGGREAGVPSGDRPAYPLGEGHQ
jgi:hypothetical protein